MSPSPISPTSPTSPDSSASPLPAASASPARTVKRSRARRAGENAFGVLLLVRNIVLSLVVLLLLAAGGWTSWETVRPTLTGDQHGTVEVLKCGQGDCTASFAPAGDQEAPSQRVTIPESVSGEVGERLTVALRPGTKEVVRTGPAGVLYAVVPTGGSLVLASLVIAGGLRWRRTALVTGLLGFGLMGGAWAALSF
ncbi:MAG: hypothetical protein ACRDP3_23460 [Streptomyces sp.]|uniref:hypothetical protein n=1 Tax=Streptomyces sp. TaxID=1931 RepID=UPI003D6AD573